MTDSSGPSWYYPDDLARSVEATLQTDDATIDHLIDMLQSHEYDAPRERLRDVILCTQEQINDLDEKHTPPALDDPRSLPPRYVSVDDMAYLGPRDFSRILGITLSSYDGSYQLLSQTDDISIDFLWSRQHRTIGLRAESRPDETPVDEAIIADLVEGDTSPATGRAPSVLGVITTTSFTADARALANKNDIKLFDHAWLDQRLKEIQLSWEIAGPVIEATEDDEKEIGELIDEQDLLPAAFNDIDPLTDDPIPREIAMGDVGERRDPIQGTKSNTMDETASRQRGVLYANPADDGDFDAFDRITESLGDDE